MNKYLPLCVAASALCVGHATAMQVEEVVVTAQKRAESIQDVPVAITAMNRGMLQAAGIDSPVDIGAVTPGLNSAESQGGFSPYIRGVGSRAVTPGNENPTAIYVDDVYQYDTFGSLLTGFSDVEQIEVLRGPQGTLFGRNATAGAIRISTLAPSHEFGGHIEGKYGTDARSLSVFLTGGLTDSLSASFSGFKEKGLEYIDNLNPDNGLGSETGGSENTGFRAKLLWDASDKLSVLTGIEYLNLLDTSRFAWEYLSDSHYSVSEATVDNNGLNVPDTRGPVRVYDGNTPGEMFHNKKAAFVNIQYEFEYFDLKSISSYSETSSGNVFDVDASSLDILWLESEYYGHALQQEFTLTSNIDGPLSWLAGVYFYDIDTGYDKLRLFSGLPYPADQGTLAQQGSGAIINQNSALTIESQALYGEIGYDITASTALTLGLRYTDETHSLDRGNHSSTLVSDGAGGVTEIRSDAVDRCTASATCTGLETSFDELTWRIVLDHSLENGDLIYASYNRGFKSGIYNISTADTTTATEPEILDAYEIGIKGTAMDGALRYSSALFYNDYSDLQLVLTDTNSGVQRAINAASATISGIEAEFEWNVSAQFRMQAGFSRFFQHEYDDFDPCEVLVENPAGGSVVTPTTCSGTDLPGSPEFSAFLAGNYTVPFKDGSRVELHGVVDYSDEFNYLQDTNDSSLGYTQPTQEAMTRVNLHVAWHSAEDDYTVSLWGKNVTDEDRFRGLSATTIAMATGYERGATYGLTATYKF